jgi:hypothetical protein
MSFGALFKMLAQDAHSFLNASPGGGPPPEPLRLKRGGFVEVDPVPFQMLAGKLNFALQTSGQRIATRGLVDLGGGSTLHRYYFDDNDTWLQVKTDGGHDDACISECLLWEYWDTKTPASQAELALAAGPMSPVGLPTYTLGLYTYQRVWGVSHGQTELIPFNEWVYDRHDTEPSYWCRHNAMLYRRRLEDSPRQEYVLISVEEGPDSLAVITSVGIDLNPADLTVT